MKKIAIIKWAITLGGGGDRQALELAINLQKLGYEVDIFCLEVNKEKCYPDLINKLNVYSVESRKKKEIYLLANYPLFQKFLLFIPNIYRKRHNLLALKDLVMEQHLKNNYDVFNYHEGEVIKMASFFEKRKNYWMLNDIFVKGDGLRDTLSKKRDNFFIKIVYKKYINRIIVLDNINKKNVKKYFDANAVIVRSGLDQKSFYFKREYLVKNKLSILATGIFFPRRRHEDLIETMNILINDEKLRNISLSIIGELRTDPVYAERIKTLIKKYRLRAYIKLLSRVSEKKLTRYYQTSDIFVFPNNPQTWGLAVFEAMIAGCVSIVSRGAGAHEVLEDNKTAFLVNPESPAQIASKIKKLINNPTLLKNVSINGQRFVSKNISWDNYAKGMVQTFSK
ncbi:MAG: glycosyltransferase family 4 protein [Candidatus Levyibacteriota bacterium]